MYTFFQRQNWFTYDPPMYIRDVKNEYFSYFCSNRHFWRISYELFFFRFNEEKVGVLKKGLKTRAQRSISKFDQNKGSQVDFKNVCS